MDKLNISFQGDCSVLIEFNDIIDLSVSLKVSAFKHKLEQYEIKGIIETVSSYRSLLVIFDPNVIYGIELVDILKSIIVDREYVSSPSSYKLNYIPVVYGGEYGPDLYYVADHNNISTDDVIKIHHNVNYFIYMLGFTGGFVYLGGMSEKIFTPRLETPRIKVHSGSVGIADKQTGIYPIECPGGWRIIGRTPIKLFDLSLDNPFLLKAGEAIKFFPITESEFIKIKKCIKDNRYTVNYEYIENI